MLMKKTSLADNSYDLLDKKYLDRIEKIKSRNFFIAYVIFLEFCKKRNLYGNGKNVDEMIFIKSKVYNFFMEISNFILKNKVINTPFFIKYILSSDINFKDWNTQKLYSKYLDELLMIEPPEDGFYRSLNFIEKWAESTNNKISDFFKVNNENYIMFKIENRLLSPWFLFSCREGRNFLDKINNKQIYKNKKDLDKTKWEFKLKLYKDKVKNFESILKEKGL